MKHNLQSKPLSSGKSIDIFPLRRMEEEASMLLRKNNQSARAYKELSLLLKKAPHHKSSHSLHSGGPRK